MVRFTVVEIDKPIASNEARRIRNEHAAPKGAATGSPRGGVLVPLTLGSALRLWTIWQRGIGRAVRGLERLSRAGVVVSLHYVFWQRGIGRAVRALERLSRAAVVISLHYVLICWVSRSVCVVNLQSVNVIVNLETVEVTWVYGVESGGVERWFYSHKLDNGEGWGG